MTLFDAVNTRWSPYVALPVIRDDSAQKIESIRVVNNALWCCVGSEGVVVLDENLKIKNETLRVSNSRIYDVAQMSNGDVIIAMRYELVHANHKGIRCLFFF